MWIVVYPVGILNEGVLYFYALPFLLKNNIHSFGYGPWFYYVVIGWMILLFLGSGLQFFLFVETEKKGLKSKVSFRQSEEDKEGVTDQAGFVG